MSNVLDVRNVCWSKRVLMLAICVQCCTMWTDVIVIYMGWLIVCQSVGKLVTSLCVVRKVCFIVGNCLQMLANVSRCHVYQYIKVVRSGPKVERVAMASVVLYVFDRCVVS
jgi:hypothetical protein